MTKNGIKYLDAAKDGDLKTVRAMLDAGVEIDMPDDRETPKNRTALMHAAAFGHLDVVNLLLCAGAKVEAKDRGVGFDWPGGNTALILAIKNKHIQIANRLLDAGANPKAKSTDTTVLGAAVEAGEFRLIKRLVELGADPEQRTSDQFSAMLNAICQNNIPVVGLFLKYGADPNAKTPGGGCLLSRAAASGYVEICQLLCGCGASANVRNEDNRFTPLMAACVSTQNEEVFRFLLSVGAKVNEFNSRNETALDLIEQTYQRHSEASPADIRRMAKKGEDVKVTLKSLEKIIFLLRKAGAKTYKELEKIDIQPETRRAYRSKQDLNRLGVADFLKSMYDGHPEWSLFAVKAPVEDVSSAIVRARKAEKRIISVPLRPAGKYDDVANVVAAVQLRNSPWTIVFNSVSWVDSAEIKNALRAAKELSSKFKTRALSFIGEDISGATAYEILDNGKSVEKLELLDGCFTIFKSSLRKEPRLEMVDDKFMDDAFRAEGIYIPCCYPMSNGGKAWLAVEEGSMDLIERADFIEAQMCQAR